MSNKAKAKHRARVMLPLCRHTKPRPHTHTNTITVTHTHNVDSNDMNGDRAHGIHSVRKHRQCQTDDRVHTKPRSIYSPLSQTHRHTQNTLRNTVRAPKKWKQCKDKDKKLLNK